MDSITLIHTPLLPSTKALFFFQAEDGIRARNVTGVQTCALPICRLAARAIGSRWWQIPKERVVDFVEALKRDEDSEYVNALKRDEDDEWVTEMNMVRDRKSVV